MKFMVWRTKEGDRPLARFYRGMDSRTYKQYETTIPVWIFVDGVTNEELPYGEVIPSYKLAEALNKDIGAKG